MSRAVDPHMNWDVEIPGEGGSTPAFAMLPEGARRGVVVLHEIFGRQPEIARVVERFAAQGYAAVAPDLFHGRSKPGCIRAAMHTIRTGAGPFAEKTRDARTWLCAQTGLDERQVGLIGFCLGGGFALALGQGFGAVSTNYGKIPPDELLRGLGPTIGCYGGRDRLFGKNGPKLERRLSALGVPVETRTYPEVGHSFLTDGHHPIGHFLSWPVFRIEYRPEIAEDAWQKILAFFDRQLSAAATHTVR